MILFQSADSVAFAVSRCGGASRAVVRPLSLAPRVRAMASWADYRVGRDPAMDAILARLAR